MLKKSKLLLTVSLFAVAILAHAQTTDTIDTASPAPQLHDEAAPTNPSALSKRSPDKLTREERQAKKEARQEERAKKKAAREEEHAKKKAARQEKNTNVEKK